uniref:Deoxynucleotidyltransferase terminal-interacting protein 2 n=1 Tax=Geotrypetes seraphini TaxID=260995 RepID=A0A6P8QED6_GEOSA|nr:deoxynucleotidyltransferase terminal-interacting protein 2 [Geotrypetes seraphini]
MVATRRGVRQELTVDEGELSIVPPVEVSTEPNNPAPQRLTRRKYKESSQSVGLTEFQIEEPGATKSQLVDLSEPLNLTLHRTTRSRSKHEAQSDGDVSEVESNCSSISSLQTSIVTRTTRSRQIKVTCPLDSVTKNKTKKSVSRTEPLTESQEEGEISEAESCCSSVSGIQMTCTTRTTRSRRNLVKLPPTLTGEPQIEDVSDAESWCSGVSVGPCTKRGIWSTVVKSQLETTNQGRENDSDLFVEEEPLNKSKENGAKCQLLVISDSECKVKRDAATEQASLVPAAVSCNRRRNESQSEHEVEEKTQKDAIMRTSRATERRKQTRGNLLNKRPKYTYLDIIDSEEELDQALEEEKAGNNSEFQLVNIDVSQVEQENSKGSLSFQKHSPLKQREIVSVYKQVDDVRGNITSSCQQATELIEMEQSTERNKQNKNLDFTSIDGDMNDDCKNNVFEADADIDQGELALKSKTKVKAYKIKGISDKHNVISLTPRHVESDTSEEEDDLSNMETSNLKPLLRHSSENKLSHVEGLFVIDKAPGLDSSKQYYLEKTDEEEDAEYEEQPLVLEEDEDDFVDEAEHLTLLNSSKPGFILSTSIDPGLNVKDFGGLYINFDVEKQMPDSSTIKKMKEKKKNKELLQKSIISPDFEKRECVPPYSESLRQLKKKRREERAKTTGDGWFGMKAPEMTEELKNDLKALKMRSAMDPKRFYKKNDRDGFPKYFQVGTVVDNPVDFYHSRIPKKQRKRTIVEELLADSEFRRYNKKKYQQIMTEKAALAAGKMNRKKKEISHIRLCEHEQ